MNFHTAVLGIENRENTPVFAVHNNELISPQKVYTQQEYPSLPCDMVKLVGRDGTMIFVPRRKLKYVD